MKRETKAQKFKRELKDGEIVADLQNQGPVYSNESNVPSIRIGRTLYSISWILYYARARNAGISCMWTASRIYANEYTRALGPIPEFHTINNRRTDHSLLWWADLYLRKTKQTKKKGQNNENETKEAQAA